MFQAMEVIHLKNGSYAELEEPYREPIENSI